MNLGDRHLESKSCLCDIPCVSVEGLIEIMHIKYLEKFLAYNNVLKKKKLMAARVHLKMLNRTFYWISGSYSCYVFGADI